MPLDPAFNDPDILNRLNEMCWHPDPEDNRYIHPGPEDECHPCHIPTTHTPPKTQP